MKSFKMIKSLLFSVLILLSTFSIAQIDWKGNAPLKLGAGLQSWNIDPLYRNFNYRQLAETNNLGGVIPASTNSFSYLRFPTTVEMVGENVYFSFDGTFAWDIAVQAINNFSVNDELDVYAFDVIPTYLSFGKWINDRMGIYGGFQYSFTALRLGGNDPFIQLGGNQRGVNTIFFYSTDKVVFKTILQYDWVRHSKKISKGSAQSIDIEAFYPFGESKKTGLWLGMRFKNTTSEGYSGPENEDWVNDFGGTNVADGEIFSFPEVSGTDIYFRGGLYFLLNN